MKNRMNNFRVTILGSGTCVPLLSRSSCSVLLETGESRVVFDCGAGTMRRLLEAGVTVFDVTHLFFSHFHPDHTGEMASFLFANKYASAPQRTTPLLLAGGRGFYKFFENYKTVYGHWLELPDRLLQFGEFDVSQADRADFADFSVTTRPVCHQPESIAFRVEKGGRSMVYSGDTDVADNLVTLAEGADLLICESALPDHLKTEGHLTPSLAGRVARKAGVKKLVLTHLYPECDEVDIKAQCARIYNGEIVVAEDLMQFGL